MVITVQFDRHQRGPELLEILQGEIAVPRPGVTAILDEAFKVEQRKPAPNLDSQGIRAPQHALRHSALTYRIRMLVCEHRSKCRRAAADIPLLNNDVCTSNFQQ